MRRAFFVSTVVLFSMVVPGVGAQVHILEVDGDVRHHAGRRWAVARAGEIVPLESRIRVAEGSGVVITDDDVVLRLDRAETFIVADVLAVGRILASPMIRTLVVDRAAELAAAIGREASREEYAVVADAVSRLDVRNPSPFADDFIDLVVSVAVEEGVRRHLEGAVVLFRALALLSRAAYVEALDTLHPLLDDDNLPVSDRQRAYVLSGIAFRGIGHVGTAGEYLRFSADLDPSTGEGRVARELVESFFSAAF